MLEDDGPAPVGDLSDPGDELNVARGGDGLRIGRQRTRMIDNTNSQLHILRMRAGSDTYLLAPGARIPSLTMSTLDVSKSPS